MHGSMPAASPPSDPIHLREHIRLHGTPMKWTTNLSNDQLREAYERLREDGVMNDIGIAGRDAAAGGIMIRFNEFAFLDGACFVILMSGSMTVIYRSDEQWERFEAEKSRCEKAERAVTKKANRINFNFARLLDEANAKWRARDIVSAERLLLLVRALQMEVEEFRSLESPHSALLALYSEDADPVRGLEYLEKYDCGWQEFEAFARCYGWQRPDTVFHIFWHAIRRFPDQSELYKSFALLAAGGPKRPDVAIRVCKEAIRRGLKDDTVSGFAGRIRRIQRKYGHKQNESQ